MKTWQEIIDLPPFTHDFCERITVSIVNETKACSTLVLSAFPPEFCLKRLLEEQKTKFAPFSSFEHFLKKLYRGIQYYDGGAVFKFSMFSVVFVSTTHQQDLVEEHLEELGFMSTKRVSNMKNKTHVKTWMIEVPVLLEKLRSFGMPYNSGSESKLKEPV